MRTLPITVEIITSEEGINKGEFIIDQNVGIIYNGKINMYAANKEYLIETIQKLMGSHNSKEDEWN